MVITRQRLTHVLRELHAKLGDAVEPHIVVARHDTRLGGTDLVPCDGGRLPSLAPGTHGGCRISAPDGEDGLHFALDRDTVAIHLDRVDARRNVVGHALDATRVVQGLWRGLAIGGGFAVVSRRIGPLVLCILGGTALGLVTPRRRNLYFALAHNGQAIMIDKPTRRLAAQWVVAATGA